MDPAIMRNRQAGLAAASAQLDRKFGTGVPPVAQSQVINSRAKAILAERELDQAADFTAQNAVQASYFGAGS